MKKILFTGGGSAGHVLPNVALITEFLKTGEADIVYMGTDAIERQIIPPLHVPFVQISCPKLIRGGFSSLTKNLTVPFALKKAIKEAEEKLKTISPDVVFSKGGYVSLPVVFAAKKLAIPCLTHESDFSPGLANKLIAPKCEYVLTSFPETAKRFKNGKFSGSLIRKDLFNQDAHSAKRKFGFADGKKVLLIFGGGSGSQKINAAVRKNILPLTKEFDVLHICGKGNKVETNVKNYRQEEYISDMASAYSAADVVLSRAGSNTVFELMALKKNAVLVPLEGQTRGDQIENARYFEKKGLCRVLLEEALDEIVPIVKQTADDGDMRTALLINRYENGTDNALREIRKLLRK